MNKFKMREWPKDSINDADLNPVPFHIGQKLCYDSTRRIIAMSAGSQGGKDVAIDTLIPTPGGFVRMGDIEVGDIIYARDGTKTLVEYVSPIFTDHVCYKITFDDGSVIVAGEDHQWIVRDARRRKNDARRVKRRTGRRESPSNIPSVTGEITITTKEMEGTSCLNCGRANWSVDVAMPVDGTNVALPIDPYVLGAWLGDGHEKSPSITSMDEEIIQRIRDAGYLIRDIGSDRCGKARTYNIGKTISNPGRGRIGDFTEKLISIGVRNNKHIPEIYLNADVKSREDLLAGLLDTDGYCNEKGQAEFCNTNETLFFDFVKLAQSLGYKVRTRSKIAKCYGRACGIAYNAVFSSDKSPFYISRKRAQHIAPKKDNTKRRYVYSVKKIDTVPTKCISVSHPSHSYLISESYIITHNTSFGPHWFWREIYDPIIGKGRGDYIAVTATYDLFKLKMLPTMMDVFAGIYDIGRYWAGSKIIELKDPVTGKFWANMADDNMWGRIILRSADALGGLESSTASAAWLDECGQEGFTVNAYNALRRRLALKRGRILMTTTLYVYNWFLTKIVKPILASGETEYIIADNGEIDYTDSFEKDAALIQFDSTVNPLFSKEEFAEARDTLSEEEFHMFYKGRETSRKFLIYDNFVQDLHTCTPFHIPEHWPRFLGVDFGSTHMAAMFYAEHPDTKKLYAYKEYLFGSRTIKQHVDAMLLEEPTIPLCYGGAKSEGQWRTEFSQAGLQVNKPSIADVDVGISRVYAQHAKSGIIYFNNLSGIIEEKNSYRRKRAADGSYSDEIMNKGSYHYLDAERYIISEIRAISDIRMKIKRVTLR